MGHVKKSFQGLFRPVLDGIDLVLAQGDFCVLIGANGSGKSTLLKLISGEYKADEGEIRLKGEVAQVAQDTQLSTVPEMTLLENIALSGIKRPTLSFYTRHRGSIGQTLKALALGLEAYIDQPLSRLSGGQRQMVAILMAIHSGRSILLLDEHTSALDPNMQALLMAYTAKQIATHGLTSLMITHNMDDAVRYGNRLIMLHQGKIVLDVKGSVKKALQVRDVLALFHRYEDQILASGGRDGGS